MPDKDIKQKVSDSTRVIMEEGKRQNSELGVLLGLVAWEDSRRREECKKELH